MVQFDALPMSVIQHVVDKFLFQLEGQLEEKSFINNIPEARNWLARNGYDEKMGARPMERLIRRR